MEKMKIFTGLNFLRFILCLYIALSHYYLSSDSDLSLVINFIKNTGFYATSVFFILSGFILSYVYYDKVSAHIFNHKTFLIKRISKIYPLFITVQTVFFIMYIYYPSFLSEDYMYVMSSDVLSYYIKSLFLIQSWDNIILFNQPAWSASNLFFFYIVFLLISQYLFKKNNYLCVVFLSVLSLLLVLLIFYKNKDMMSFNLLHHNPFIRLPEFLLGMSSFVFFKKNQIYIQKFKYLFIAIGMLGIIIAGFFMNISDSYLPYLHNGFLIFFEISLIFGFSSIDIFKRSSSTLGDMSLVIYLLHYPIILLLNQLDLMEYSSVYLLFVMSFSYVVLKLYVNPLSNLIRKL